MTRRRLILAAALAAAAVGAAWWLLADGLSAEERRLVGTWQGRDQSSGQLMSAVVVLDTDRRFYYGEVGRPKNPDQPPCWWSVRDGSIEIDLEPSALGRALRPVASLLGLTVGGSNRGTLTWLSDDELLIIDSGGGRAGWVRVQSD